MVIIIIIVKIVTVLGTLVGDGMSASIRKGHDTAL